jgi:hypothetical protein
MPQPACATLIRIKHCMLQSPGVGFRLEGAERKEQGEKQDVTGTSRDRTEPPVSTECPSHSAE